MTLKVRVQAPPSWRLSRMTRSPIVFVEAPVQKSYCLWASNHIDQETRQRSYCLLDKRHCKDNWHTNEWLNYQKQWDSHSVHGHPFDHFFHYPPLFATMRRPADLTVDTTSTTLDTTTSPTTTSQLSECKVPISPRSSVHSFNVPVPSVVINPPSPPQPSIRLLFSLLSRRDLLVFVLPAIVTSLFAGGIAPFMTLVVGQAFDAYSNFSVATDLDAAKHKLLHDVGMTAVELLALAIGALALSSLTSSLWIWTGERNLMAVRKQVYDAVSKKDMVWYDTKMGGEDSVTTTDGNGPVGAGGLMAQFAKYVIFQLCVFRHPYSITALQRDG